MGTEVHRCMKKPRKCQPQNVRARIIRAALDSFARCGFEGASTREIADTADVSVSLLLYHFQSKDNLWKAVFEDVADKVSIDRFLQGNHLTGASAGEQLRRAIEHLVRQFSALPALHRLMTQEGFRYSERLGWMCDTYVGREFETLRALILAAQAEGSVRVVNAERLRFAIIALASMPFAVPAEFEQLTGCSPFDTTDIQRSIEFINQLVFKD